MSENSFSRLALASVTTAIKDGTHGTHARVGNGVPFLSAKNVTDSGTVAWDETDDCISESEYEQIHRTFRLQPRDLLLTIVGSLGRRAVFDGSKVTFQRSVAYVRPDTQRVSERFLFHWFGHGEFQQELVRRSNSTAQAGLYLGELAQTLVPDCPLVEQVKIAEILDTLDTTIRQTEAIIEKLKQVKQGLLHDLLTRGIDANGELRPTQSEAPHLYKDSPLGWIPREWEARTVGDSCDLHNGLRLPLASDVREKMPGPFPYFGPTGILDFIDEFRVDGTFVLIGEDGDHFLKFANRPMTQLVSGRFNVNNHAHLLAGRICRTEWVDVWFRHRDITLFLTRQGAGRFKLNKASLQSLPMATPTDREQGAILEALASMEAHISAEARVRNKLVAEKAGLMDDLLTGRVRVTPLLAASTAT